MINFEPMKAKVIRGFTCVNSKLRFNIGDTYEADSERISYLSTKGYVVAEKVAHIPKMEVAAPIKAETKPKKKRNEHK